MSKNIPINFNPQKLAQYESDMWRAYYERAYLRMFRISVMSINEQFKVGLLTSGPIAYSAMQAAHKFAKTHSDSPFEYQKQVLPDLTKFFSKIKSVTSSDWDPTLLAQAELNWWVLRRLPGHNSNVVRVGMGISAVYELFYGVKNHCISRAGFLRAYAAHKLDSMLGSDQQPDYKLITKILTDSYQQLYNGLHGCNPSNLNN